MDGQHEGGGPEQLKQPEQACPPSDREIADLRRFLGVHTAADRPGVHTDAGERPDNVRRLNAHRDRINGTREVE